MITVPHPTFCCVVLGLGLWLRWGWAVTIAFICFESEANFTINYFKAQIQKLSRMHGCTDGKKDGRTDGHGRTDGQSHFLSC